MCYKSGRKIMITRDRFLLYGYSRDEAYLLLSKSQDQLFSQNSFANFPVCPESEKKVLHTREDTKKEHTSKPTRNKIQTLYIMVPACSRLV